jgi:cystathionine beta-lyase
MKYDFDRVHSRKNTDCAKWDAVKQIFGSEDVIPMWVADMDFVSAEPVIRALHERVDHGIFGYTRPTQALRQAVQERLKRLYQWQIGQEEIVFLPGLGEGRRGFFFPEPGWPINSILKR